MRNVGIVSTDRRGGGTQRDLELEGLLCECANGDQAALEALYGLAAPKLYALCVQMLRNQALAEDVLQEAFVQIWKGAAYFDPRRASPMTWMAAIVRHRAIDQLRKRAPEVSGAVLSNSEEPAAPEPGPLEQALRWSEAVSVKRCLEELDGRQREAIELAFFRGLTHAEVAAAMALPLGSVKSWIRRGLTRLKTCLESVTS